MPSCNNHFRKNDNDQRKKSQDEDYRKRFKKEIGSVYAGHALHHIYPKETLGFAFKALGIDVNAPKNLAELPVDYRYGKKPIVHQPLLHGKDDEERDTETAFLNDFFIKHGLAKSEKGGVDFSKLEKLSDDEKHKYRNMARRFAVDFLKTRTDIVDFGPGLTAADFIGGAPYTDPRPSK